MSPRHPRLGKAAAGIDLLFVPKKNRSEAATRSNCAAMTIAAPCPAKCSKQESSVLTQIFTD
jgi:hypothetical protein